MKDILEEILAYKRKEVEREKAELPPEQLFALVEGRWRNAHDGTARHGKVPAYMTDARKHRSMRESLAASRSGIIAEFKRKSPSKGWIKEEGRADVIPAAYAAAGAAALSILTDGKYFGGCLDYIRQARPMTDTPILRKEFIIDEYQLYQACQAGADAVLLIAAALTRPDYERLTRKAHDTDVENSFRIASLLPDDLLWVSESGISEPDTVRRLRDAGFRGFLMGEAFMRQPAPGAALKTFIQSVER